MSARKKPRIIADDLAEHVLPAGRNGHSEIAFDPGMVDQQRRLVDADERIAAIAQQRAQFGDRGRDAIGIERIARIDGEGGHDIVAFVVRKIA